MADPFSVAAATVSIVVPALHGVRLLLGDLQKIKDAPKTIKQLTEKVQSVDAALALLQGIEDREWELLGTSVAEQSQTTIKSCSQACELFRAKLQRWTIHSGTNGELAWKDRANVGFLKTAQIAAMSEQITSCKRTINSVVSIATLYSSVRQSKMTEEIQQTIIKRQEEVQVAITMSDRQVATLEGDLAELSVGRNDDGASEPNEDTNEGLRQVEEGLNVIKESQKLLNELLSKAQVEAVAKASMNNSGTTTVTFGANNSGFQAGNIYGGFGGMTMTFGGK